jgi:hypothetical protein
LWYNRYRMLPNHLEPNLTPGAQVEKIGDAAWRLAIPAGPAGRYRLAQIDDYSRLRRGAFPWRPPLRLSLRARASAADLPGTWGFGLWNDPFSMGVLNQSGLRLPALPNTAWFFFASPPSHLSFRDNLPASGWLASVFRSAPALSALLPMGAPALPLLAFPAAARRLRRLARRFIAEGATALPIDPTEWHTYQLDWELRGTWFSVDEKIVLESGVSPYSPLGLVIWIDNQTMAFTPHGQFRYGTLAHSQAAWIEIDRLDVECNG